METMQRRLLATIMLAAANHRLHAETAAFLPLLPELITDCQDAVVVRALMLLVLQRRSEALRILERDDSDAARIMQDWVLRQAG